MKHKLKLSLWALGIFILVGSQLLVLMPTPRASAATTLTLTGINEQTYKFSAYTAFYPCFAKANTGKTPIAVVGTNTAPPVSTVFPDTTLRIIGFLGSDGNDNDGKGTCYELAKAFMGVAGYANFGDFLHDLGYTSTPGKATGAQGKGGAVDGTIWATTVSTGDLAAKYTAIASSKGVPTTVPSWGRYALAIAALDKICASKPSTRTSVQPVSVPTVSDDLGTLTNKDYYPSDSKTLPVFPTTSGGSSSSCSYLIDNVVKDSSVGATALAAAMAESRIASTIANAQTAICQSLDLSAKEKADNSCEIAFGGYLKACIDEYYSGTGITKNSISRAQRFDETVVATCVEGKANKAGYKITADQIAGFLSTAQDSTTPADTTKDTFNDDPCSVLGDVQMRWLACAMLTTGAGIAQTFYSIIQSLLYTPVAQTFDSIKEAFKTFRLIGMGLIVITGLIMIIAQATGSDLVDAYTVKKVLPKLGVALIGIALALPLLRFAVDLTNNIGFISGDFIANVGGSNTAGIAAAPSNTMGAVLIALVGAGAGLAASYVFGISIIAFILIIAIGLLVGVVTLAIRQLVIVVLILLAPLAIASYVLPGTDKLWKFWKNTLLTTLVMFPIIMLFIKSGVLMAGIFGSKKDDPFSALMAVLVYFAPYFMIPFAFKMSGGLMGNVFGMLNDRMQGAYKGLRSWASNTRKRRTADFVSGAKEGPKIFGTNRKTGRARDPIASMIAGAALTYEGSLSPTKAGREAYRSHRQKLIEDATKKKQGEDGGYATGDTDATKIAMKATSRKQFVDDYVKEYTNGDKYKGDKAAATAGAYESMARLEGSLQTGMGSRQMQIAAARGRVAADNTSYFNEKENKTEYSELFGDVAQQVKSGNISFMDGVSMIRENKNRADMSGFSTGQTIELLQAAVDNGSKDGGSYGLDEDQVTKAQQYAYGSANASSTLHGNPRVAKAMAGVTKGNLDKARAGEIIPLSEKTREQTQAAINERAKEIQTRTNAAAAVDGSGVQSISAEQAQGMAEREYREDSLIAEYAKLSNIQDSMGQAMPDVQDVYKGVLGEKVDLASFAENKDFVKLLGITDDQISGHAEMTNADILERLRPHMNERRYVWGAGQEEAAAHNQPPQAAEAGRTPEVRQPGPLQ